MLKSASHFKFVILARGLLLILLSACGPSELERYGEPALDRDELRELDLKIGVTLGNVSGAPRLKITQSFVMPRSSLLLSLPKIFLREDKLYQRIEDLRVSKGARILDHSRSMSHKILRAEEGERVEISYLFRPDNPSSRKVKERFSAPIIRHDYFQFVGLMALLYPVSLIEAGSFPLELYFDVPGDFDVFTSFGSGERLRVKTNFDRLRDTLFVAGNNMTKKTVQVGGNPVHITFEGMFPSAKIDDYVSTVKRLLEKQRDTFDDHDFPTFLVHFLARPGPCNGKVKFSGTAHPNSFRAFFPTRCAFSAEMKQLISHELMHMWIGKKIRVGKERGHIDGKWFTEGWTDFFGRILAYRAGVLSEAEYFQTFNRQLEKYSVSGEKRVTLRTLVKRMYRRQYTNRRLEDVPYQQGEIMAMRINQAIKSKTGFKYSLDDVVREMLEQSKQEGGSKNFSISEIAAIVDRYVPGLLLAEYEKIREGGVFVPPSLKDCRYVNSRSLTRFERVVRRVKNAIVFYKMPRSPRCDRWLN